MHLIARLTAVVALLAACQMQAPEKDTAPLPTDEISVTKLDSPAPVAAPSSPDTAPPPQSEPPASPEQALCETSRGQWSALAGSSGHVCVHPTRDSGKSCHRKDDCQGECLAQSGTCSPIMPLMGCNAILQADGTEVTLCLQ